jgi:hypothetical protein
MTWTTLHGRALQLGFELACHANAATTRPDGHWVRVGSYDQLAELWAQPVTDQARALSSDRIAAIISACSQHVSTIGDYDADFHASLAPIRAALDNPDHGCMPA